MDKKPAGRCALYQVGDIASVMDLTVLGAFRDEGVAPALTSHVLTMAKRLAIKNVCVQVDAAEPEQIKWFERAGFMSDGTIEEFERIEG